MSGPINTLAAWANDTNCPLDEANQRAVAYAAIAELVEADREYDAASRDWEQATNDDPLNLSDERWRQIADRFEAATMRRIAALAKFEEKAS